jgi:hypothetical protein
MKERKGKKRETAPTFKLTQARHDVEPKRVQTDMMSACGAPRGPVGALNRCPSSPWVVGLVARRLDRGEWVMEEKDTQVLAFVWQNHLPAAPLRIETRGAYKGA